MTIKQNTTDLQAVLAAVNALPEASEADTVELATPIISVDANGLITATVTQEAGLVEAGVKIATRALDTTPGWTITPSTSNQIAIHGLRYALSNITVKGDANLIPENIAEGVSIFGVEGTHSGGSGGTIETCSLEIRDEAYCFMHVFVSQLVDGVVSYTDICDGSGFYSASNVICGSIVAISADTASGDPAAVSGTVYLTDTSTSMSGTFAFGIVAGAGEVAQISSGYSEDAT